MNNLKKSIRNPKAANDKNRQNRPYDANKQRSFSLPFFQMQRIYNKNN